MFLTGIDIIMSNLNKLLVFKSTCTSLQDSFNELYYIFFLIHILYIRPLAGIVHGLNECTTNDACVNRVLHSVEFLIFFF